MRHEDDVVITGMGVVSPLGIGIDALWTNLLQRRSGAGPITLFDATDFPVRIACEVTDFNPADYMEVRDVRRTDRFEQLGVAGAAEAVRQAGGPDFGVPPDRVGVLVSCAGGGYLSFEAEHKLLLERGPKRVSPLLPIKCMANGAAALIAMDHGFMGPSYSISSACATSASTIGDALLYLKMGMADVMIAGGADCPISRVWMAAFARMGALSKQNDDPEHASRPFDLRRDGFVMAEGSGILVLERREIAERRGAKILGRLTGYGSTTDAYHMTAPQPDAKGAQIAMSNALVMAGVSTQGVDMISAHGTSTPLNDVAETRAIKAVFKDEAKAIPVIASKSQTGHSFGAAGGVQAIISLLAIENGVVPATINLEQPDPDCDLDYVSDGPREQPVSTVLLNQFGFGGHNACLVLEGP